MFAIHVKLIQKLNKTLTENMFRLYIEEMYTVKILCVNLKVIFNNINSVSVFCTQFPTDSNDRKFGGPGVYE